MDHNHPASGIGLAELQTRRLFIPATVYVLVNISFMGIHEMGESLRLRQECCQTLRVDVLSILPPPTWFEKTPPLKIPPSFQRCSEHQQRQSRYSSLMQFFNLISEMDHAQRWISR